MRTHATWVFEGLDPLTNRTGFGSGGLISGFRNCCPEIEVSNGVKKGQRKPNQANVKKKKKKSV